MLNARALVTCDAESDGLALEELRESGAASLPGRWLDTGDAVQGSILLVDSELPFAELSKTLHGSIYIRHLAPVELQVGLQGTEGDLDAICALVPELAAKLEPGRSFSVQSRVLGVGKLPYRKVVLNERLSQALEQRAGVAMDCRHPEQVVSVLCTPDAALLGVSGTTLNRSEWPGGKHRFKKDDEQVSRAEFKLLEALSVFELNLPAKGRALDIGASPGGWTRLLALSGLEVDAVDPGYLDKRLFKNPRIHHMRKRIQEYLPGSKSFVAVVNDMKMDAQESVEILLGFSDRLERGGFGLMTLKMPRHSSARQALGMVHDDLNRLSQGFEVVGARQLYHNRSEVTVALSGRSPRR